MGVLVPQNGWLYNVTALDKAQTNPKAGRTVTGATTLVKSDAGKMITVNSASTVAVTIPNDATGGWEDLETVNVLQRGAGVVTFTAGSGVTLRTPSGYPASVQYAVKKLTRIGANEWALG